MTALSLATAPERAIDSRPSESVEAVDLRRDLEPAARTGTADVPQQVLHLKRKLEEAVSEVERLQNNFTSQKVLEGLLRQGRAHLLDLRSRLQRMTAERDRVETEFSHHKIAHQDEVERLQAQIQAAVSQARLQQEVAERHERDMLSRQQEQQRQIDTLLTQLQEATAERDRVTGHLEEREAAHAQFAQDRAEERRTAERLLAEADANQRDMVKEIDDQRHEIQSLLEAAMRSQALAREIMRAHETAPPKIRQS